jgi:hypothetical protein
MEATKRPTFSSVLPVVSRMIELLDSYKPISIMDHTGTKVDAVIQVSLVAVGTSNVKCEVHMLTFQ